MSATSNTAGQRRRKKILIEKDFQYRFTVRLCLLSGLLFALFTGISLFFIKLSYEMLIQSALIQMPEMVSKLRWEFRSLSTGMVINWTLFVGAMFVLGVLYTQRIAGPIYAFRRKLQDLARGLTFQKMKLRRNDEFQSLEQSYNQAIDVVQGHLIKQNERSLRARDLLLKNETTEALNELNKLIEEQKV